MYKITVLFYGRLVNFYIETLEEANIQALAFQGHIVTKNF